MTKKGIHSYGDRYVALISINTPLRRSRPILTVCVWLVPFLETIVRCDRFGQEKIVTYGINDDFNNF